MKRPHYQISQPGAAPRQWRSPRRGARRVGALDPSNRPQRGHGHPLVFDIVFNVFETCTQMFIKKKFVEKSRKYIGLS